MSQVFRYSDRALAYNLVQGRGSIVVFLGGFQSNKEGDKALYLESWARKNGRAFLRFDYSGHGASSGRFVDGSIGDWLNDALTIIAGLTEGPLLLVGSSLGGWISLLIAKEIPERISGMVTIAAAPDFTEDKIWVGLDKTQKQVMAEMHKVEVPSKYSDEPYVITKHLIEEGRNHLVLRSPLDLPFPTRFLHGSDDEDVDLAVAHKLFAHANGDDLRLTVVKGADHRFSDPGCLALICEMIEQVSALSD